MKNSLETRLGIFVALALIAVFIIVEMVGGLDFFKRGYRLHALFGNIQELKVGDAVKMAGVQIGRVDKITLDRGKVNVTMKLNPDVEVKTDSKATVKFAGLMGQNFVSLDFGTPGAANASQDTILESDEQPDISIILKKLDNVATGVENLTKSFTPDTINNLFGPVTDFVKANSENLGTSIKNLKNISGQIASGEGTVGKLIYDQALYNSTLATMTNMQSAATELQSTIADARKIVDEVNAGQGSLGKLVKDDKLYNDTSASMSNLKEILQKINSGQGTAGKIVNDQSLYKNAQLSLQKLDKAADGLEDQGPLSVLGIAVNSLF